MGKPAGEGKGWAESKPEGTTSIGALESKQQSKERKGGKG